MCSDTLFMSSCMKVTLATMSVLQDIHSLRMNVIVIDISLWSFFTGSLHPFPHTATFKFLGHLGSGTFWLSQRVGFFQEALLHARAIVFEIVLLTLTISVPNLFSRGKFLVKLVLISLVVLGVHVGKRVDTFKSFNIYFAF
ncbi:uncharacterized protein EV154DRAFT_547825 [Mucor mucedo]|uniref:uncharacterized protein n=1 Tax=Mucor mucedo TaxID=29922 RepID=UPI0022201CDA|nr:uncharacterized protein EV154DRAFT_547825 [Mucor mucedo]KAI7895797.1 hypothetical protein EV154DRAFT_547825 [Mucor mucedo]